MEIDNINNSISGMLQNSPGTKPGLMASKELVFLAETSFRLVPLLLPVSKGTYKGLVALRFGLCTKHVVLGDGSLSLC